MISNPEAASLRARGRGAAAPPSQQTSRLFARLPGAAARLSQQTSGAVPANWCSMPWTHLFVGPDGRIKPCCRFKMARGEQEKSHLKAASLQEAWESPFMGTIRSAMLQNKKIPGCIRCREEEASGKQSLRERYNSSRSLPPDKLISSLKKPKIRWLELGLSNKCNLACRMCDSRYSSKWFESEKEFYGKTLNPEKNSGWDVRLLEPFLDGLAHIKFTGGEPLLMREHIACLDRLIESGRAGGVFLNYSSNMTVRPGKRLIEKWKKFRHVEIAASFDGIKKTWELARWPSRWERAEKSLRFFFRLTHEMDLRIGLRSSISANNILGMAESFDWWIENWNQHAARPFDKNQWINPTHVSFPGFLSSTVFPKKYKSLIARRLRAEARRFSGKMRAGLLAQVSYMMSRDDQALLPQLRRYTLHFDKSRGQSFFRANPALKGLFDF